MKNYIIRKMRKQREGVGSLGAGWGVFQDGKLIGWTPTRARAQSTAISMTKTSKNPLRRVRCSTCGSTYYEPDQCPMCQAGVGRARNPRIVKFATDAQARKLQRLDNEIKQALRGGDDLIKSIKARGKDPDSTNNRNAIDAFQRKALRFVKERKELLASLKSIETNNPSAFFSKDTESKAKRVVKIRRVREKETGQVGEIIGVLPGSWIKVKWDNRDRPTLIKRSEIVAVRSNPKHIVQVRADAKRRQRTVVAASKTANKRIDLYARVGALWRIAAKLKSQGKMAQAAEIQAEANRLYRQLNSSIERTAGPVGILPNPTVSEKISQLTREGYPRKQTVAIAFSEKRAGKLKNPSVRELAETFQGRASGAVSEYKAAASAPSDLARIGKLVFLKLRDVRRQIAAPGAMVAVDTRGQLWIVGRASLFTPKAQAGSLNDFGEIEKICYLTAKTHVGNGGTTEYVHEFGEDGGKRPHLLVDHEGMPVLRGGDYKIRAEGIVN